MMRYLVIVILTVLIQPVIAQDSKPISKGNFMLGGNISYNSKEKESWETSQGVFQANVGYFTRDNLAVGILISYQYSEAKNSISDYIYYNTITPRLFSSKAFYVSPFLRYISNKGIFVQIQTGYGINKQKSKIDSPNINHNRSIITDTFTANLFNVKPSIGYSLFLSQKVAVEFALFYDYQKIKSKKVSSVAKTHGANIGFQVYL